MSSAESPVPSPDPHDHQPPIDEIAEIRAQLRQIREELTSETSETHYTRPQQMATDAALNIKETTITDKKNKTAGSKPAALTKKSKLKVVDRVLDEQLDACCGAQEQVSRVLGLEIMSKDFIGDVVKDWFKTQHNQGTPVGMKANEPLDFTLVVQQKMPEINYEHIEELALRFGLKIRKPVHIDRGFLRKYSGDELAGKDPEDDTRVVLVDSSYESEARRTAAMQLEGFNARNKQFKSLAVPSVLDLILATFARHELQLSIDTESTYGRDFRLPAHKILGVLKCVPAWYIDDEGGVNLRASAVSSGKATRYARS